MTVATFTQPDNTSQTGATYKGAIDHSIMAMKRLADMFAPHQVATPNMTVQIDAGHVFDGTTLTELAQQTSATITAPSGNPRRDIVYIDRYTGAIGIATGTEAASPSDPSLPFNSIPIARVALTVGQTTITNADLTDIRSLGQLGLSLAASFRPGIDAGQLPTAEMLGALAFASLITAGDLRGTANRLMLTDSSGVGAEGTVTGLLALAAGVLSTTAQRREYILLQDQKSEGTAGGGATGGSAWSTRALTIKVLDTGNNCSLTSNQFTLDAGTYEAIIRAPFYNVGGARLRLRNITDSSTVAVSENALIGNDGDYYITLLTRFTIAASKAFEVQYAVVTGTATIGLGNHDQQTLGTEIYTTVQLYKVS